MTGSLVRLEDFNDEQVLAFLTTQLAGDEKQAHDRLNLLSEVRDLLGLARNLRMLSFIARVGEQRLRVARDRDGEVTAATLYQELLDLWLVGEYERAQPRGAVPTLEVAERWHAVTQLACGCGRPPRPPSVWTTCATWPPR